MFRTVGPRVFRWMLVACAVLSVSMPEVGAPSDASKPANTGLFEQLLVLARTNQVEDNEERVASCLELGNWYHIGPFKKKHFDIVTHEFETVFKPEADVLSAGRDLPDLDPGPPFPDGQPDGARRARTLRQPQRHR